MSDIRLHLGCGKRYFPGYIHLDLAEYPHVDFVYNAKTLPMFEDSSVSRIYASHLFEYFDRIEAIDVLKEWHRVLKKGGILNLSVPDFEALVQVYTKHKDLNLIRGPLYGRWVIHDTDRIIYHKTVYDFRSLKSALRQSGYKDVRRVDWREFFSGELQGFDDYSQAYIPHMDKQKGILISLNVEAEK